MEASNRNKALVENQTVYLEKDVSESDRFGRLLRYVYLESGAMVNELLVAEGFAQPSTFPPDVKYPAALPCGAAGGEGREPRAVGRLPNGAASGCRSARWHLSSFLPDGLHPAATARPRLRPDHLPALHGVAA